MDVNEHTCRQGLLWKIQCQGEDFPVSGKSLLAVIIPVTGFVQVLEILESPEICSCIFQDWKVLEN